MNSFLNELNFNFLMISNTKEVRTIYRKFGNPNHFHSNILYHLLDLNICHCCCQYFLFPVGRAGSGVI